MRSSLARCFATLAPKVQLKDLTTNPLLNFVVTSDFHRVDIGIILCRRPIYFDLEEPEYEQIVREHKLNMKHDLYCPLTKELNDYNRTDMERPMDTSDDVPTHYKRHPDGRLTEYRPASKDFRYCQPDVTDPHRIQAFGIYNVYFLVKKDGQWMFPQVPATMDSTLHNTKNALMKRMTNDEIMNLFTSKYPMCVQRAPIPEAELAANPYMAKCVGRKVFYYQAFHDVGATHRVGGYEDYAWVPKPLMNRYLSKQDFDFVMPHLKEIRN